MTAPDLIAACRSLPVFPLPNVVLLPDELLPLHVFEPRYRALVAHVLAGDRRMGIATLQPGFEDAYEDAPPLHAEVAVALVARHQELPDGRSNVLLRFEAAATLVAEHATVTPFRQLQVALLPEVGDQGYAPSEALRVLAFQVAALVGPLGPRQRLFELQGRPWVDAMARLFLLDADERRAYLRLSHGPERVAFVEQALLRWLSRATAATGGFAH